MLACGAKCNVQDCKKNMGKSKICFLGKVFPSEVDGGMPVPYAKNKVVVQKFNFHVSETCIFSVLVNPKKFTVEDVSLEKAKKLQIPWI